MESDDRAEQYRQKRADRVDAAVAELAKSWDNVIVLVNSHDVDEGTISYWRFEGNNYAIQAQVNHWAGCAFATGKRGINFVEREDGGSDSANEGTK